MTDTTERKKKEHGHVMTEREKSIVDFLNWACTKKFLVDYATRKKLFEHLDEYLKEP